ncbi:MAG: hypothetical protein HFJ55_03325 [Clostridia bacterium]|nr:hypothetical protein [Clostridia bacterium]
MTEEVIPLGAKVTVRPAYCAPAYDLANSDEIVINELTNDNNTVSYSTRYNGGNIAQRSSIGKFSKASNENEWQWENDNQASKLFNISCNNMTLNAVFLAGDGYDKRDNVTSRATEGGHTVTLGDLFTNGAFIRLKIITPVPIELSCQESTNVWNQSEDEYWYYEPIFVKGNTTEELKIIVDGQKALNNFNTVIAIEAVPVMYDEAGIPYADWNYKSSENLDT